MASPRRLVLTVVAGVAAGIFVWLLASWLTATPVDEAVVVLLIVSVFAAVVRAQADPFTAAIAATSSGLSAGLLSSGVGVAVVVASVVLLVIALGLRRWTSLVALIAVLAWVAWPLWLGSVFLSSGQQVPTWMTRWHPIFTIDAATSGVAWIEQPHIYGRTPVGSDLPILLPNTVWPTASIHLALASVVALARVATSRVRRARRSSCRTRRHEPAADPATASATGSSS